MNCPYCTSTVIDGAGFCVRCGKPLARPESAGLLNYPGGVSPSPLPADDITASWQKGKILLDEFEVERELGAGGMGRVYLVKSRFSGYRFAVKTTKLADADSRRRFLAEIQNWIDLPEHPYVTACYFIRTVEEQIVIFAEYVDGGSLGQWISEGRLRNLAELLDVAIQFAWGLHAAHELGLVHQDVKPGNALMTSERVVKISDFGLAQARAVSSQTSSTDPLHSQFVRGAGTWTEAYRSPEQAKGLPLTRMTDVWSWGLSVLEMFQGGRSWLLGELAAEVLTDRVSGGACDAALPDLSSGVADVLRKCFEPDPTARWNTLLDAANNLVRIYEIEIGEKYSRPAPSFPKRKPTIKRREYGLSIDGLDEKTPQDWLRLALEADGRDPKAIDNLLLGPPSSDQAQAIADLAMCEQAQQIFERLAAAGQRGLNPSRAVLSLQRAYLHGIIHDYLGAISIFDRAITIYDSLDQRDLKFQGLAASYFGKAVALRRTGENQEAISLDNKVIAILEEMVHKQAKAELAPNLIMTYLNKSLALSDIAAHRDSIEQCERAIDVAKRLADQNDGEEAAELLAQAYSRKASVAHDLGDNATAVAFHERAISIFRRLVKESKRYDLLETLALVSFANKAIAIMALGDNRAAVAVFDEAIELLRRLDEQTGGLNSRHLLANLYWNKATPLERLGQNRLAMEHYQAAVDIYQPLINQQGRREFQPELAKALVNKAGLAQRLGDYKLAIAEFYKAIKTLERLVEAEGRKEYKHALAAAYMNKGNATAAALSPDIALTLHEKAIEILEQVVYDEGHKEYEDTLGNAHLNKGSALWSTGSHLAAAASFLTAVQIFERLGSQPGKPELRVQFGLALINMAQCSYALGVQDKAKIYYDRAVNNFSKLAIEDQHDEYLGELAMARGGRAVLLAETGEMEQAKSDARMAIPTLQSEIARTGRADLRAFLNKMTNSLGRVL
jgi:serine/threonine protein kinase